MKTNNQCAESNEIIEINLAYKGEAERLIENLHKETRDSFLEIDCAPNGALNAFHYGNGFKSAVIISDLSASFLGQERAWLENKISLAQGSNFKTDWQLGEEAGLWTRVSPNNYEEKLNWNESFCIKHQTGAAKIWHPQWRSLGHHGSFATRSGIVKFIHEGEANYLQPFYFPLPSINGESIWKMVYRLVFFCGAGQTPELIGGLWITRPSFKVYPAKDAVIGLISPLPRR